MQGFFDQFNLEALNRLMTATPEQLQMMGAKAAAELGPPPAEGLNTIIQQAATQLASGQLVDPQAPQLPLGELLGPQQVPPVPAPNQPPVTETPLPATGPAPQAVPLPQTGPPTAPELLQNPQLPSPIPTQLDGVGALLSAQNPAPVVSPEAVRAVTGAEGIESAVAQTPEAEEEAKRKRAAAAAMAYKAVAGTQQRPQLRAPGGRPPVSGNAPSARAGRFTTQTAGVSQPSLGQLLGGR